MKQTDILKGFDQLGKLMVALGKNDPWSGFDTGVTEDEYNELNTLILRQTNFNGWFTEANVRSNLYLLGRLLKFEELTHWCEKYSYTDSPKRIAIIMAGNIPLVGFHDFLSVIVSGNTAVCKLSSDDKTLLPKLIDHLIVFVPELKERIELNPGRITSMDAVIATGSDNSLKYFEQYFGNYPHIFRSNRTSVAVLDGTESKEELELLGNDIFSYFGLGCRNVSHLIVPENYDFNDFFDAIYKHSDVVNNNKYGNNYDYNRTVFLMNQHKLLDNNFVLLHKSEELFSPLAMIYYHTYKTDHEVTEYLELNRDKIQAVVGKGYLPFGESQNPGLEDYADNIDTMQWLRNLQ